MLYHADYIASVRPTHESCAEQRESHVTHSLSIRQTLISKSSPAEWNHRIIEAQGDHQAGGYDGSGPVSLSSAPLYSYQRKINDAVP